MLRASDITQGIDTRTLELLPRQYPVAEQIKSAHRLKFCNWHRASQDAVDYVYQIGLDNNHPKRMLDVGCGFGYFVRACILLGHDITGIDLEDEVHGRVWDILQVRPHVRDCVLEYTKMLPVDLKEFDLITMMGFGLPRYMPLNDWHHYRRPIQDILSRLKPGGRFWALENVGRYWKYVLQAWKLLIGKRGRVTIKGQWRAPIVEVHWHG